jgi:hypothetical protein
MAYNFKNLADVELLNAMPEEANVLVEVNGKTKRAPNIDVEAKIVSSETLEEVPEGATVLAEVNGQIKRVPGAGLGGGIKTAIIKDSRYDDELASMKQGKAMTPPTYTCLNMTFEEAYETMENGEPLSVLGMFTTEGPMTLYGILMFAGTIIFGVPCIYIVFAMPYGGDPLGLYWTADGISIDQPGGMPS